MLSYSVMLLVVSDVTPRSGNGQPYLGEKNGPYSLKYFFMSTIKSGYEYTKNST